MNALTTTVADIFRRPADDNYSSMLELLEVTEQEMNESREFRVQSKDLSFSQNQDGDALALEMSGHRPLQLGHWSLTQVAKMAKLPVDVIERLYKADRLDLVVDNMNTLFPILNSDEKQVLVRDTHTDVSIDSTIRAVNGSAYSRLWDNEVFAEVDDWLIPRGFTPALPFLRAGALRSGLMHGLDTGLFRGDQCSFGFFFVQDELECQQDMTGGLQPGVMVWNSEVGARSFGFHTFYYHRPSGSILIWTPANHKRKRFVHRGDIRKAFKEYLHTLEDVALKFDERYTGDMAIFNVAAMTPFAASSDAAVERLKGYGMSAPAAKAAVMASKNPANAHGSDLSYWRIALGIAWEAGQTSRAESLVDNTLVATSVLKRMQVTKSS